MDDLPLMQPKDAMQLPPPKQRQMRLRTKGAITDQDISLFEFRMQQCCLSHVVRPQRRGQDFQKKARACVEKRQQMRYRKAAADVLAAGLTEFLLEFRCVGHAEGRAVDVEGAMAAPASGVVEGRT
jgi:hypothetical protein